MSFANVKSKSPGELSKETTSSSYFLEIGKFYFYSIFKIFIKLH